MVEETWWRSGRSDSDTMCVMWEFHIGVTTLEDCRLHSNFCIDRIQTHGRREPHHSNQRS